MTNDLKITKPAIDDFKKIQCYMAIAKKENATETYAELKREYLSKGGPYRRRSQSHRH